MNAKAARRASVDKQQRVAVVAGLRTPFARQATALMGVPALELGRMVVRELLDRSSVDASSIDLLVYGQVIQNPATPNIARELVLATGMDVSTDAYSVSRACATSFQAVANCADAIALGHVQIAIAGGADSSSVLPICVTKPLADTLLRLSKARSLGEKLRLISRLRPAHFAPQPPAIAEYSTGLAMGESAEQMARNFAISRADQDALAHRSHELANAAWQGGLLDDEVMVAHVPPYQTAGLVRDNNVRPDSQLATYGALKPAFDSRHGTVTAGNSTPLTDGAGALLLMREDVAKALGHQPLGYLRSHAFAALGVEQNMLLGPAYATPLALARAGITLADLSLIDMHEAFAAQTLANLKLFASDDFGRNQLGLGGAIGEVDMDKFNVLGGSLAYGHPFAATGARMITQTLRELKRRGGGLALTTACAAGGLGAALIWEVEP